MVADRLETTDEMVAHIRGLPLQEPLLFFADMRNVWTVDACLRRALEALLDAGRHILARGFGKAAGEYKEIATALGTLGVLSATDAERLRVLAGYRNRLVHFYHEIEDAELFEVASRHLDDVEIVRRAFSDWLSANPAMLRD